MYGLIIAVHVLVCALLIIIVLIQQGRGGGLIDSLSSAENIFGTKTSNFLVKLTSVLAVIFFFTCLSLAFLSIRKGKSLLETNYWQTTQTKTPVAETPAPKSSSAAPSESAAKTTTTTAQPTTAAAQPAATAQPATTAAAPAATTAPAQTQSATQQTSASTNAPVEQK